MRVSNIYTETTQLLKEGTRTIVHQGGQYSGKTVNILGALAALCSEEEPQPEESVVTTVTSMSFPHLKGGALRDFETFVYPSFRNSIAKYHKTDHIFTFKSGMQMEFKCFETEYDARGAKRKRLFVNEANRMDEMKFFQLHSRSDQTVIDYNPSIPFWAHANLIGNDGVETRISDHRHNPFLPQWRHDEIEKYKGERFRVYSRGLTGNVEGVIFPNWQMIDEADFPADDEEWIYCIDFGWTNDPTAIMKILLLGNTLYVKELAYEPGIPPRQMNMILTANGWRNPTPVYCDHSPDAIKELRLAGVKYATPARKGQGSINGGIELLHTFDVKYPNTSQNLHRERGLYIWEVDKVTGKKTNEPVGNNNHCFDAIRYGAYTKYLRNQLVKMRRA